MFGKGKTDTVSTTIAVRRANLGDLRALEILLMKGHEESEMLPPPDIAHAYHTAINMIQAGMVFVATEIDADKKRELVVGTLMLDGKTYAWNPEVTIIESVHFYVLPEYRARSINSGTPARLNGMPVWRALLEAGKDLSTAASEVHGKTIPFRCESFFSAKADNRAEAKDELFKQAGFAYTGGNFIFFPPPTSDEQAAADNKAA